MYQLLYFISTKCENTRAKYCCGQALWLNAPSKLYFYKDGYVLTVKMEGNRITLQKISTQSLTQEKIFNYKDFPKALALRMF